jgi:hypothetical protein
MSISVNVGLPKPTLELALGPQLADIDNFEPSPGFSRAERDLEFYRAAQRGGVIAEYARGLTAEFNELDAANETKAMMLEQIPHAIPPLWAQSALKQAIVDGNAYRVRLITALPGILAELGDVRWAVLEPGSPGIWSSPLAYAIRYGNPTVFQQLVACGVRWTEAIAFSRPRIPDDPEMLLQMDFLHFAIKCNKPVMVDAFISNAPSMLNLPFEPQGDTPLTLAVRQNSADVVRLLVTNLNLDKAFRTFSYRVDWEYAPYGPYNQPATALELASHFGFVEIIDLLGQPVDQRACNRALQYAAINGGVAAIQAVLRLGAEVNTSEYVGLRGTPLANAINCGKEDAAILLIENNAELTATVPETNETVFVRDLAQNRGQTRVIQAIIAKEVLNATGSH